MSKNGTKVRAKSAAVQRRRASRRDVIGIDLAAETLRGLMIEQFKYGPHYITVYRGSRAELVAAGISENAFPIDGTDVAEFQVQTLNACCTGSQELLGGSIRSIADGFEMEIDWKLVRPYVQCSHPALAELARMLLEDVCRWTRTDYGRDGMGAGLADLAHPIDILADDERAVDYKPLPCAPRVQVTAEFNKKLGEYASHLYESVFTDGEVLPCAGASAAKHRRPSHLRLVVDNEGPRP